MSEDGNYILFRGFCYGKRNSLVMDLLHTEGVVFQALRMKMILIIEAIIVFRHQAK